MASQGAAHPYVGVLTQPPFFPIEGINPASPITTQTEQIDQLNTLLLQSIDANFARVHQIITARILPEIKRFAIASEPTLQHAEFWHRFFTSAAGTSRTVLPGEMSELTMSTSLASADTSQHIERDESVEGSFMSVFEPPHGVSSTPLPGRHRDRDVSWDESSVGSPYARLDRPLDDTSSLSSQSVPSGYAPEGPAYDFDASTGTLETPQLPQFLRSQPRAADVSATTAFKSYAPSDSSHASVTAAFKSYAPPEDTSATTAFKNYAPSDSSHASVTAAFGKYADPTEISATTVFRNYQASDISPPPRSLEASRASSTTLTRSQIEDTFDAEETPRVPQREASRLPRPSTHLIDLGASPRADSTSRFDAAQFAAIGPPPRMHNLLEDTDDDMSRLGSPVTTMKYTLPPRAHAIYEEAKSKTPARSREDDETTRQLGDLLADITAHISPMNSPVRSRADNTEHYSPSPMLALPEKFRRYSEFPADLGHGRKLFDTSGASASGSGAGSSASPNIFAPSPAGASSSGNIFAPTSPPLQSQSSFNPDTYAPENYTAGPSRAPRRSVANTSYGSDMQTTTDSPARALDDSFGDDDDDDSFDSGDYSFQPDADAAAAAQGFAFDDDSYMSEDATFLAGGGQGQGQRGGRGGGGFTDTHVGAPRENATEVFGRPSGGRRQFTLHQQDEMSTFHGGRLEDARQPQTPLGGGGSTDTADMSRLGLGHR